MTTNSKYFIPQTVRPLVSPDRLSPRDQAMYKEYGAKSFPGRGLGAGPPLAPKPARLPAASEKSLQGSSNASATFGVDRPGGLTSGLGGQGIPAATIDLVAGHMGAYARNTDDTGRELQYNPNFQVDAARMYISELTNLDENMKLPEGSLGERNMTSGIGVMADAIAIQSKGQGGIKIACVPTSRDSQGQKNLKNAGIDFLVGDGEDQQPLVKGENLMAVLLKMSEEIDDVRGTMEQFVRLQGNFNDKLMNHNHNSPFWGLTTAPSFNVLYEGFKQCFQRVADVETGMIFSIINKELGENNYFNPIQRKYLLSGLVRTG